MSKNIKFVIGLCAILLFYLLVVPGVGAAEISQQVSDMFNVDEFTTSDISLPVDLPDEFTCDGRNRRC